MPISGEKEIFMIDYKLWQWHDKYSRFFFKLNIKGFLNIEYCVWEGKQNSEKMKFRGNFNEMNVVESIFNKIQDWLFTIKQQTK